MNKNKKIEMYTKIIELLDKEEVNDLDKQIVLSFGYTQIRSTNKKNK